MLYRVVVVGIDISYMLIREKRKSIIENNEGRRSEGNINEYMNISVKFVRTFS